MTGKVNERLRLALEWWKAIFSLKLVQRQCWLREVQPPCHLYCDARGEPPRVAAVLFRDGKIHGCDMAPPESLIQSWATRKDSQIMGLEILSIALGLSSFNDMLRNRDVIIWSDNTGAEHATANRTAKSFDHNCLVHAIWQHVAELGLHVWVNRVPTKVNIADLPSRESYELLRAIGAIRVAPKLGARYLEAQTWEALSSCIFLNTPQSEPTSVEE